MLGDTVETSGVEACGKAHRISQVGLFNISIDCLLILWYMVIPVYHFSGVGQRHSGRRFRMSRFLLSLAVLIADVGLVCHAQTSAGSITGEVEDSTGAVIAGATVKITSIETGRSITLTTNHQGVYEAASLPAGKYNIAVSQTGFQSLTIEDLRLDPGERVNRNLTLQVGGIEQSVSVEANATQVNTATGEGSGTIDSSHNDRIEVNGRNYQAMLSLIPGINNTSSGKQLSGLGLNNNFVVSSNGLGVNKNVNMVDGSFNMNVGSEQGGGVNPELDTIREVRVLTDNYSARYGYSGGAQILIETKSGQRDFHGQ